jgi:hypothetical protein
MQGMTRNMSWMGRVTRELETRKQVLPTKMRVLFRRMLVRDMSQSGKMRMEELGAKVGLTKKETLQAIANYPTPSGLLDVTASRPRIGLLTLLLVLVMVAVACVMMIITGAPTSAGPTTTYVPGTRYASISPQDFR